MCYVISVHLNSMCVCVPFSSLLSDEQKARIDPSDLILLDSGCWLTNTDDLPNQGNVRRFRDAREPTGWSYYNMGKEWT